MRYTLPVAAAEPYWRDVSPGEEVAVRGIPVAALPPSAARTLRQYRDPVWLTPTVGPVDEKGSSFTSDEGGLRLRISQAREAARYTNTLTSDLARIELEHWEKWTWQRGGYPGWDMLGELGMEGGVSMGAALRLIGAWLIESGSAAEYHAHSPYPWDTNSGPPFYTADPLTKVFAAYCAAAAEGRGWPVLQELFAYAAGLMQAPEDPHCIQFSRTGPLKKEDVVREVTAGGPLITARARGFACRRRDVKGVWSGLNIYVQPASNALKYLVRSKEQFAHYGADQILLSLLAARQKVAKAHNIPTSKVQLFGDDISKFDKAVRALHQREFADEVLSLVTDESRVETWRMMNKLGVLCPPVTQNAAGFIYTRPDGGETTSGDILTSLAGCVYNFARTLIAISLARGTALRAAWTSFLAGEWDVRIWGDDTMLILREGWLDVRTYEEASASVGYSCKVQKGAIFLMTYFDLDAMRAYPLAARAFQQTCGNEQAAGTQELELLGVYARTANLKSNPFGRLAWRLITTGPMPALMRGAVDRDAVGEILREPAIRYRLLEDLKARRNRLREWADSAEHSEASRQTLLMLRDLFGAHVIDQMVEDTKRLPVGPADRQLAAQRARELARHIANKDEVERPGWIDSWDMKEAV